MLKGDLSSTTLASVLLDLAGDSASGSLILSHPDGEEAQVFMRSGLVCGIDVPDRRADLGAKLVSSGILAPEALADAQEAQRTDLSSWNLGELLVHLGYVDETVVQGFVTEQLHEALWDLMRWTEGKWKFRKNAKTREDNPPLTVVALLESLRERGYEWETIAEIVDSPNAIPMLSARGDGAPETTLDSDAWSMLCKIDGTRTVAELAADCGYTLFEAGQVLVALVDAGLVDVGEEAGGAEDGEDVYGSATALAGALAGARNGSNDSGGGAANGSGGGNGAGPDDALSRLARLATEVTSHAGASSTTTTNPLQLDVMAAQLSGSANLTVPVSRKSGESFAAAMGRVSGALVDALGPAPEHVEEDPLFTRRRPAKAPKRTDESIDLEEQRRRRRAAAAAELAEAQAAVESLRPDRKFDAPVTDTPPRLVDLEAERARVAAREAEEAARHATEGAAREAAERFARDVAEQAARIQVEQAARTAQAEAEEAERKRVAEAAEQAQREAAQRAAEEAARLAAEQAAADEAAKRAAEEAARIAAERAVAEEAARVAAEEAARIVAEKAAAEKAAAEQAAAEKAAAEQAAAEQAAAEQAAAEEAARVLAEQAAAEAAEEAARQAAEEAARQAAEEAERQAAEEAERLAAEEAARQAAEEAERQAAEEAARQAAEADAARVAQEAEARAALAAAQADADAAAEAARLAQEAEDQAVARAAAEEAERVALQDAIAQSQRSAEAAAATAMLVELHNTDVPHVAPSAEPLAPAASLEPDPEPEPAPMPTSVGGQMSEGADTAALLRELSSLGEEDAPPSLMAAAPPPRPRPANPANDKKAKKKIGLFGL